MTLEKSLFTCVLGIYTGNLTFTFLSSAEVNTISMQNINLKLNGVMNAF